MLAKKSTDGPIDKTDINRYKISNCRLIISEIYPLLLSLYFILFPDSIGLIHPINPHILNTEDYAKND